jgi:hypothetical protein
VRQRPALVAAVVVMVAVLVMAGVVAFLVPSHRAASTGDGAPPARTASTTVAPTTTTTVDPGTLPQQMVLPSATGPVFQADTQALWRAIADGNPTEAMAFFFPLSAYIQVKAISDPVHDWQTRLVANFDADVMAYHAALGADPASAQLVSVSVPSAAVWVVPGVEYNKGSYYRVYGTTIHYLVAGAAHSFPVASMISWRGQWYVVHLGSIR